MAESKVDKKKYWGVILLSMRKTLWKWYIFQKMFFNNPFFNYFRFFEKIDKNKYKRRKKYIALQLYGESILRDILSACKELNMKPFLLFGTLLGHQRDNGFIAHDTDIDLGMLKEDFSQISQLKSKMKKKGYIIRGESQYGISFRKMRFKGLHVDITLIYEENNRMACSTGIREQRGVRYYPREVFSGLLTVKFMGKIEVFIPAQADNYLTLTYGEGWKIINPAYNLERDAVNVKVLTAFPSKAKAKL